ncbi:MAG: hypothetical protein E7269_01120 [Lachnospiraceae bacterium]|nr:hypothetical protein [Lachnospiraceae bacterium]
MSKKMDVQGTGLRAGKKMPEHITSPLFSWVEMMQLQKKADGTKEVLLKTREELERMSTYCSDLAKRNQELEQILAAKDAECKEMQTQLAYQTEKHKSWKTLAMSFHDAVWELMDRYVL